MDPSLTIDGAVRTAMRLSVADLAAIDAAGQVPDVSRLDPKRAGAAVTLAALLDLVSVQDDARWLTLHAAADDFHASIPLEAVRDSAVVIYRLNGQPLPPKSGGPFRFLIPNLTECHAADINECANVKFVDRLELSAERGFDNRPTEEEEHAELHRRQAT